MAKDIGMTIHKGIVVSFGSCAISLACDRRQQLQLSIHVLEVVYIVILTEYLMKMTCSGKYSTGSASKVEH